MLKVVDAAVVYNGDAVRGIADDPETEYFVPDEGGVLWIDNLAVPAKAPHRDVAEKFINFILDPALQQTLAENGVDAPVVKSVTLTPDQAKMWTYGADMVAGLKRVDYEKMNAAKEQATVDAITDEDLKKHAGEVAEPLRRQVVLDHGFPTGEQQWHVVS